MTSKKICLSLDLKKNDEYFKKVLDYMDTVSPISKQTNKKRQKKDNKILTELKTGALEDC